jgi:hypothetical protein
MKVICHKSCTHITYIHNFLTCTYLLSVSVFVCIDDKQQVWCLRAYVLQVRDVTHVHMAGYLETQ